MKNELIKIYYPKTIYAFNKIRDYYLLENDGDTTFSFSPYITAVIDINKNITYLKEFNDNERISFKNFKISYEELNEDDKLKIDSIISKVDEKYDEIARQPNSTIPPIIN